MRGKETILTNATDLADNSHVLVSTSAGWLLGHTLTTAEGTLIITYDEPV